MLRSLLHSRVRLPPFRSLSTAAIPLPTRSSRAVGLWLSGTAAGVFAMVALGGVTRLTRSGLSIVEWRPEGEALPRTETEWAVAFKRYQAFPEYARVNSRMTLEEFKPIYWMEWAHRAWGRGLGIIFGVPLLAFAAARALPRGIGPRLVGLLALGGAQGAIGWWMVRSGLEAERFKPTDQVRVSPYRLATHLTGAWLLYSGLAWTAMDLLRTPATPTLAGTAAARALRPYVLVAAAAAGVTVYSGAFVAGNDAGHAFNDWPFFAGQLVPEGIWDATLGVRNFFENTATVQFDHRMLAYTTLTTASIAAVAAVRAGPALPTPVRRSVLVLLGAVCAQATLGVLTLVLYVPVHLGAAHQAGALATWTAALWSLHALRAAGRGLGGVVIPRPLVASGLLVCAAAPSPKDE